MRSLCVILICTLTSHFSLSQQTERFVNNWHIGNQVGISFNSGSPQSISSNINTSEVTTSFSDGFGNVLFYAGGALPNTSVVFDKDDLAMPNGNIYIDGSSSCGLTVAPKPGTCDQYYFFHLKSTGPGWGLHYSLLDLSLPGNGTIQNPSGDIDPLQADVLVYGNDELAEKIKVVQQANTENYWVLCRSITADIFYAFEVTALGVNPVPVVSNISGQVWGNNVADSPIFGWLAIDRSRSKFAEANGFGPSVIIYDFDNTNGSLLLNETITLGATGLDVPYGVEFSPDGKVLYCSWFQSNTGSLVSSFDMTAPIGTIGSTRQDYITANINIEYGGLTKAPDGKLYGSRWQQAELLIIEEPNNIAAPNVVATGYDPSPGIMGVGMPNLSYYFHPHHYSDELAGDDQIICDSEQATLGLLAYDSIWVNYSWEPQAMISGQNNVVNPMTIPLYSDQEYTVHLTTACGDTVKSDTVLISVTETGSPEVYDDTTYCSGEIISEISVVDEGLVYTWYDDPELLVSIGNGASFLPFENLGTTTYYVTAIDGGCESVPDSVDITILESPELQIEESIETCSGVPLEISAVGSGQITWAPADVLTNTNQNTTTFIGSDSMSVYIELVGAYGCVSVDSIEINVIDRPIADFQSSQEGGCSPFILSMTDVSTSVVNDPIVSWVWMDRDAVILSTSQNPNIELEGNFSSVNSIDSIDISLLIETATGCMDTAVTENSILLFQNPNAAFNFSPTSTTLNEPLVQFTDNSSDNVTLWSWDFGNGYSSNLENPSFVFQEVGVYTVALVVEAQFGCLDSTTASIEIKPPFSYYIPNAFTPNGDGKNDSFKGEGTGINDFQIMIFNRWGEEIFYSENPEIGWDGKFKGKDVEVGAYAYMATLLDLEMNYHKFSGSVIILR